MKASWAEILKQGVADGPIGERHMGRLRREIVFNRKVPAYGSRLGWGEGWLHGAEQCCQNQALPKFVLQMVLSAAGEGAFIAACPHLTSDSSTP